MIFFLISTFFVGCITDDFGEIIEVPQTNIHACYFDYMYNLMGNPEISINDRYRIIEFDITNDKLCMYRPTPIMISEQFNIPLTEFACTTHTTCLGNLNPGTSENIYILWFKNNDRFDIDKNNSKETKKVKIAFVCYHIN